jgi:hypothetical protein
MLTPYKAIHRLRRLHRAVNRKVAEDAKKAAEARKAPCGECPVADREYYTTDLRGGEDVVECVVEATPVP